jgi:hypothetical protein
LSVTTKKRGGSTLSLNDLKKRPKRVIDIRKIDRNRRVYRQLFHNAESEVNPFLFL